MDKEKHNPPLTLRPYQAMCLVCSLGEEDSGSTDARLKDILDAIRAHPDQPVALRCNSDDVFAYQSPGAEDDTPEGTEFNMKRDMDILLRMDLAPGSILPARYVFVRLLRAISSCAGICGYDTATSDAWKGCPKAKSGSYKKGREKGIDALLPPRSEEEMARDKKKSLKDMYEANTIRIRPHILVCAVAQYGNGARPPYKPDNLPEMIQHVLKNPGAPITLVPSADWMMCGPCPDRSPELNACVRGGLGSRGLYNEMKDLNVLRALGLTYGAKMSAKEIYRLLFERIPKVDGVCALQNVASDISVWRDGCGRSAEPCPGYRKGREMLMKKLA
ncbi:MAG: hypothetical protein GXP25_04125 [Planctomycetes bacterium]|nr:hypothetical protein [Planctomycetota bacterium]